MNDRVAIAQTVADHLFATEEALDTALTQAASLAAFMPEARQRIRVSAEVGQGAIEHVIGTITMLGEARRRIVEAHRELAEATTTARIPPRNFGGFINKPSFQAGLKVVGDGQVQAAA